ncbi:S8 family peptidase [Aporhodopirellula aestuarii]|uniref:S8 family serine peptidase n=1 Tax=Aporhodopirellula aestuarii TaxID=2950107 RepID=A0ABT0U417_9BACT|nr:S8 family serine peptidase [Aporhodopirellula aestuarii]MCM2371597.1 S8 family serine peptidase [Aporhodopirellula aestuarii]
MKPQTTVPRSAPTGIDLSPTGIESCEPRFALSASMMGAWLAPLADPLTDHTPELQTAQDQPFSAPCPADMYAIGNDAFGGNASINSGVSSASTAADFPLSIAPAVLDPSIHGSSLNNLDDLFAQAALNSGADGTGSSLLAQSARIGASSGFDGLGQTIAVIDSGIAYDHYAFGSGFGSGSRVVGGWDFAENDADPYDDAPAGYHGSHVAGLASGIATTLDGSTFRGVAPGADIVALRVFDDAGRGNLGWIEQALRWVHDNQDSFDSPITTVNLSLGTELNDSNRDGALAMLEDELQMLYEDDILVFAAAGNSQANLTPGADDLMYPASSQWVTAVGSVDTSGNLSGFSQRENGIFTAEGQQLQSAVPEHVRGYDGYVNDYAALSGTSMASPQVAAASMLVRQAMEAAGLEPTSASILDRLESTSVTHTDPSTGLTYRTLDLEAAVDFGDSNSGLPDGESVPDNTPTTIDGYVGGATSNSIELDLRNLISGDAQANGDVWLSDEAGRYLVNTGAGSTATSPIVIDAGEGGDSLQIFGSTGSEQLTLRPSSGAGAGNSLLTFPGGVIELRGFESVSFVGGGGQDRATMYDSDGDDVLRSSASSAQFTGRGFEYQLEDVDKFYVYATAGGSDTAHLSDSVYDDQLVIRPQFSSMRGGDQFQAAFGFERVFAYAENGGHDAADLGDSAGNDFMSIAQTRSLISGVGYRASASGFENVVATASQGGEDTVRIYVDSPDGSWHTSESLTQWTGADGTSRIARGFERSEAFEQFETVPVGSQAVAAQAVVPQTMASSSDSLVPPRSLDDLKREADDHLRGLRQLFEDYM